MKRTKEWWNCLTKEERSRLVYLERAEKQSGWYGGGGYLPDDCCECGACSTPHLGTGLCPSCLQELLNLINKADKKCSNLHKDDSMRDAMEEIEEE